MCIIAAKPVGIKMPSDKIIENMWYSNSDGAGFMYADDGYVHIRKGFMTYGDFRDALDELSAKHDLTQLPLVMHFRITTHGGTKPENCHPFPISDSVGVLSKLDSKARLGVAHNGVINITPREGISDTMEYIITQLAPLHRAVPDFYRNKDLMLLVSNAIQSRMAFLTGKGEIYTIGSFVEDEGIQYSNSSYKWQSLRSTLTSCYDKFGWHDPWDYYGSCDYPLTNGSYYSRDVMWLDSDFGYITGADETEEYVYGDMLAIDEEQTVYRYSELHDCLIPMPGAFAWSNSGVGIRFNPESDMTIRELIFKPETKSKATNQTDSGKKKNKSRK